jgi:hypothetical protein
LKKICYSSTTPPVTAQRLYVWCLAHFSNASDRNSVDAVEEICGIGVKSCLEEKYELTKSCLEAVFSLVMSGLITEKDEALQGFLEKSTKAPDFAVQGEYFFLLI